MITAEVFEEASSDLRTSTHVCIATEYDLVDFRVHECLNFSRIGVGVDIPMTELNDQMIHGINGLRLSHLSPAPAGRRCHEQFLRSHGYQYRRVFLCET